MKNTRTPPDAPLAHDEQTMREVGYQAIDMIVEHLCTVRDKPVASANLDTPRLPEDFTRFRAAGRDPKALLAQLGTTVFDDCMHLVHPRFFGYIPGPANYVSAIGDLLSAAFNIFAGTAPHNLGPYEIEKTTIAWLCELTGLGATAGGLFVSGGSVASLTALTAARHVQLDNDPTDAVIYCSSQTHSSIDRALFILGFAAQQVHVLDVDADLRLDVAALTRAIAADKKAGKKPFCVIGNAGTTNSGAVDPLADIGALCEREGLWFHVDAAYGGGALLVEEGKRRLAGIGRAHSIALDPHKWLFQSFECGCVLVRDPRWLRDAFRRVPDYMRDTDTALFNFRDMSPQVTRSFKAFKLWLSLQVFGVAAFEAAVQHGLDMARLAQTHLEQRDRWQIVTQATLGIVTFRHVDDRLSGEALDALNEAAIKQVNDDGYAFMSSTRLSGRLVMRLCPLHPGLTHDDIVGTLDRLEDAIDQCAATIADR